MQQNDTTHVVSEPETYDSPTDRITINRLSVDELDNWLDQIRSRRLVIVQKLEAAAKVSADKVRLVSFLKLEKQMAITKRALTKLDADIERVEKIVHKCRLLAMAAELEVSEDEELEYASSEST
jgi:hypothetical protein